MSTPNDPSGPQYGQDPYSANAGGYDPTAPYGGAGQYDPYGAPSYPAAQPFPGYPAPPSGQVDDPDSAMGIVGLVLSVVSCGPIGLIVSWIALNKSKARGFKNTPALIGAILGGVFTLLAFVPLVILLVYLVFVAIVVGSSGGTYLLTLLH